MTHNKRPQKTSAGSKRQLTARQRRFVEGKLHGKSSARAARDAGYSESVSRKANELIADSPAVRRTLDEVMELSGVKLELLAQRIRQGLDAMEIKVFQRASDELITMDLINYSERRAMIELILRVKGLLKDKHEHRFDSLEELLTRSYGDR